MTYRLIGPAKIEYRDSILYYLEEAGSQIASDFDEAIEATLGLICEAPILAKQIVPDIRQRFVDGFPFSIIYAVEDDEVVVLSVKHDSRADEHWQARLQNPQ